MMIHNFIYRRRIQRSNGPNFPNLGCTYAVPCLGVPSWHTNLWEPGDYPNLDFLHKLRGCFETFDCRRSYLLYGCESGAVNLWGDPRYLSYYSYDIKRQPQMKKNFTPLHQLLVLRASCFAPLLLFRGYNFSFTYTGPPLSSFDSLIICSMLIITHRGRVPVPTSAQSQPGYLYPSGLFITAFFC